MPLTTFRFFIFAVLVIVIYFIVPKKGRWIVLLVSSLGFYALNGLENSFFILITAASTFLSARWIGGENIRCRQWLKDNKDLLSREERKRHKQISVRKRKAALVCTLLLNFGLLCFFKYSNFVISQINVILRSSGSGEMDLLNLLVPLGISFYTFTSMGYLADVYWEKTDPQNNFFKMLLFTSFFPQIVQGPISNYRQLGHQLYEGHAFDYTAFKWGVQRFLWGLLKKLGIAAVAANYINYLFESFQRFSGITVFLGILLYAFYIYADFSGYMDMMCGFCQILGIELAENFMRPYFSKSISEYWRRWHITLGEWFKNYIYYPVGFSRFAQWIGKKGERIFGNTFAKNMPGTIALIIVWFSTGLWHGANWGYIIWGLVNGIFVIATLWLDPFYARLRHLFHIREDAWLWRAFQVLRTFILISFIKILPEVGGLRAGLRLWKQVFSNFTMPSGLKGLLAFIDTGRNDYDIERFLFMIMLGLILVLIIASLIQRKHPIRESFNKLPMVPRVFILAAVFIIAVFLGASAGGLNGAFLYEQF